MKKIFQKIRTWFWFTFKNPIVRKGEKGAFKWTFRRLYLDIETVSGNFKARFTAAEHPYAYLVAGQEDSNILGFCEMLYFVSHTITTDQQLVNEIGDALHAYEKRLEKKENPDADEPEEVALEEVKQIYEKVEQLRDPKTGRFVKRVAKSK